MMKNIWKRSAAAMAFCICILISLLCVGCTSQQTISELVTTLGSAASGIAAIEGDQALATKLVADTQAASTQVLEWKTGTPAAEAIEALNLVEDDLNLLPATGPYVPLIDLSVATVESILALLPQAAATSAVALARSVRRQVAVPKTVPKNKAAFLKQWRAIVAANPQLAPAKI